jgi:hypothetical protein
MGMLTSNCCSGNDDNFVKPRGFANRDDSCKPDKIREPKKKPVNDIDFDDGECCAVCIEGLLD